MALRSLCLALLAAMALAAPAKAVRFYVNPSTGDDRRDHITAQSSDTPWKTITHALRMAHIVGDGKPHVIDLASGTYSPSRGETFPLKIESRDIHLYSPGDVVFDGEDRSRLITITAAGTVPLRNFSLINGRADRGGAVSCVSCTLRVVSSRLIGNEATDGGDVISVRDGRLEFTNNLVRDNGAAGGTGPILEVRNTLADTSKRDVIRNNTFYRNRTSTILTAGNRTDISSNIFVGFSGQRTPAIVDSAAGVQPLVRYNLFWDTDILYLSDDRDSVKVWRTVRDTTTLEEQGVTVPSFVTNVPYTVAKVGAEYVFDIQVEGDKSDYKFTVINDNDIPAGMSPTDAQTGVLRWTPASSQVGDHALRLEIIRTSPTVTQEFLSYVVTVYTAETFPDTSTPAPVITVTDVPDTSGAIDTLNTVVPAFAVAGSAGGNAYGDPLFLNIDLNRFELLVDKTVTRPDKSDTVLVSQARDKGNPIVALHDALLVGGQLRNDIGYTGGPTTTGPPTPGSAGGTKVTILPDSVAVEGQAWTYAPTLDPAQNIIITDPINSDAVSLPPTMAAALSKKPPITWTPALADTGRWFVGIESFYIGGSAKHYFDLRVRAANERPRFTSTAPTSAPEDAEYVYAIQAVDDDGQSLTWSLEQGPAGMTLDSLGVVRWTPDQGDIGSTDVVVRVTDAGGAANTHAFTLEVTNTNDPPAMAAVADTAATEDVLLRIPLSATDPDPGDSLFTFSLATAPSGAAIDSLNRIAWTPAQADTGANAFTVRVADAAGAADSSSFTVTVIEVDDPPTITSQPLTTAAEDTPYEYAVIGVDEESQPLSIRLVTGPAAMNLDTLGVLHWTPTVADTGAHTVTVEIADPAANTDSQTFQLTVVPTNDTPVIVSRTPADSLVLLDPGIGVSFSVEATDEEGDALTRLWYLNGSLRSDAASFLVVPDTVSADTVVARVTDGQDTTSTQWIVDARAIARISIATDTVDFGRVLLGESSVATLKVRNPGRTTLTIEDLQVGNLAFTAAFGSDVVARRDSTTLTLSFAATSRGSRSTLVQFATNDPDRPTVAIPVAGFGAVPTTAALDADLTAGDQAARTGTAPIGDTLAVDIEVGRALELTRYAVELSFAPQVLTYAGFTPGSDFLGDGLSGSVETGSGTVRIAVTGGDSSSGAGALGRAFFVVADDAVAGTTTTLDLTTVEVGSAGIAQADTLSDLEGVVLTLQPAIQGDTDGDGILDLNDFFTFADDYGTAAARSDFDGNGVVDLDDFFLFADYYSAVAARPVATATEGVDGLRLRTDPRPASARSLTLELSWQGEPDLRGAGLWLVYDPAHLSFESVRAADDTAPVLAWSGRAAEGRVEVAWAPTGGATVTDAVGLATFRRLSGEATQVRALGARGRLTNAQQLHALTAPAAVAVAALPQTAQLYPAHPNPFNPETVIPLFVPEGLGSALTVRVFDLLGRRVRTLVDGDLEGGHHRLTWRGRDDDGRHVAAGVYLVELRGGSARQVRKVLLLK